MSKIGIDTLESRIWNVIEIHRAAKDVTQAEVIGVLETVKLDIYNEEEEEEQEFNPTQ